jgi:hypothetical protein
MLISLDLPNELVAAIDAANDALRITPPVWPFGSVRSVILQNLTGEQRKQYDQYIVDLKQYKERRQALGGRNTRSRSALITGMIEYAVADKKLWEEITKFKEVPPLEDYLPLTNYASITVVEPDTTEEESA